MKKKVIIFAIIGVVLVAGIIAGLFFFLNRDSGEQTLQPDTNQIVDTTQQNQNQTLDPNTQTTPEPEPEPVIIPSYLDMYDTYTSLPGVEFRVPKTIMSTAISHEEIEGSLNGKTVIYETPNSFAIKKIGSFMMGVAYFEKEGVYDSMYVSSITGAKKLQITEDMSFDFDDINFNSTSFNVSKVTGQKRSVISVKMIEPEYTNDVYEGYMVIVVNPQNKGYMMFIATTESEFMKVDVQSMVNSLSLTGEDVHYTVPLPDTFPVTINVNNGPLTFVSGEIYLRNDVTGEITTGSLIGSETETMTVIDVVPGTYKILGSVDVRTENDEDAPITSLNIIFDNSTVDVSAQAATIDVDLTRQTGTTPFENTKTPESWINAKLYKLDSLTEAEVKIQIFNGEEKVNTINLKTMESENQSITMTPGTYTIKTFVNDTEIDSQEIITTDMTITTITVSVGETNTVFAETPIYETFITIETEN